MRFQIILEIKPLTFRPQERISLLHLFQLSKWSQSLPAPLLPHFNAKTPFPNKSALPGNCLAQATDFSVQKARLLPPTRSNIG